MLMPLRWLRNPKRMSDELLMEGLDQVMVQLRNRTWADDDATRSWLEGLFLTYLREVEARIAQGRLFD